MDLERRRTVLQTTRDAITPDTWMCKDFFEFVYEDTDEGIMINTGEIRSTISGFATLESMIEAIPELEKLAPALLEKVVKPQALVPNVQGLMCKIAGLRGEEREGCGGPEALAA